LQLPLYSAAAQQLLAERHAALPWKGGYWVVSDGGFQESIAFHERGQEGLVASPEWEQLRSDVVRRVFDIVRSIRRGEFAMFNDDPHCTRYCEFRTVCRVHQTRALGKQWPPPPPNPR